MDRFSLLFRVSTGVNLIAPLLPVSAAIIHRKRERYQDLPWMNRLTVLVSFDFLVNWAQLGTSLGHIHNAWLSDLALLPGLLLTVWVLDGLGPEPLPRLASMGAIAAVVLSTAFDAVRVGLGAKWPLAQVVGGLLVLGLSAWRLKEQLTQDSPTPARHQPALWLLGTWILSQAFLITFSPMYNLFLQRLSRDWILIPWFVRYLVGLGVNLGLARTFLCPKPS